MNEKQIENILIELGLMYNDSKMIDDEEVDKIIGGLKAECYERVLGFGNRVYKAVGNKRTLILWDCGNGWYQIITES